MKAWGPAIGPRTEPGDGNASAGGASKPNAPRPRGLSQGQSAAMGTDRNAGGPPRSVAGAVGRPARAAAGRSPSGARPPAGTVPGSRPEPLPPAAPRSRSSSDASRSASPSSRPAGTGLGCSASWPGSSAKDASTTATAQRPGAAARVCSQARCRPVAEHHLGIGPRLRGLVGPPHQPQTVAAARRCGPSPSPLTALGSVPSTGARSAC